jgi:predicted RecA/RadA family phage recombinase
MATNIALDEANQVSVEVANGTKSGDIVTYGGLPAVALEDEGQMIDGQATCKFNGAVWVDVTIAVAAGDLVYAHGSAGAQTYNKTSSGGKLIGPALDSVDSGGGRIKVKLAK